MLTAQESEVPAKTKSPEPLQVGDEALARIKEMAAAEPEFEGKGIRIYPAGVG